jgi:hypothetical protein
MNPSVSGLKKARKDLIEDYELQRPDEATHFRAELSSIKP